jgi:glyoxylase-like metal-dependent hydrolase (beta-lactamase superfamily II)
MSNKIREVLPGIFLVHLPLPMKPTIVNVYLVRGGDEWALVDTGMNSAESIAAFGEALAEVGCPPDRLKKILCTHHHPDHYGTSETFRKQTGAAVHVHRAEYASAQGFKPGERSKDAIDFFLAHGIPLYRFQNVPRQSDFWAGLYAPAEPDVFIDDGDVIEVGDRRIEVVWTPGHAPGHCVMVLPKERAMIAGDHLLPKITPHVGYTPSSVPNPLGDFLDSQRKIQRLDIDLVLPAHGGVFPDHRHRSNQIIQHHEARLQEMLDILHKQPRTAYDVARRAFGFDSDSPITYQFPATFETLAHLEYLRHAGRIESERRDGLILYVDRSPNPSRL